jgi:hypothetical protein
MSGTAEEAAGIGVHIADWRPEAIDTEDGAPVNGGADLAVVSGRDAVHATATARYA